MTEDLKVFPISRDPPEGGTFTGLTQQQLEWLLCFQFLGIRPKGEHRLSEPGTTVLYWFPISRDPPEGGTKVNPVFTLSLYSSFQFLGIPSKGEQLTVPRISLGTDLSEVSNF